jgi:hypothetical protein
MAQRFHHPLIVRRDDCLAYAVAFARLIDNVLDERLAGLIGDNLGGKAGRAEASGNDDGGSQAAERS